MTECSPPFFLLDLSLVGFLGDFEGFLHDLEAAEAFEAFFPVADMEAFHEKSGAENMFLFFENMFFFFVNVYRKFVNVYRKFVNVYRKFVNVYRNFVNIHSTDC